MGINRLSAVNVATPWASPFSNILLLLLTLAIFEKRNIWDLGDNFFIAINIISWDGRLCVIILQATINTKPGKSFRRLRYLLALTIIAPV